MIVASRYHLPSVIKIADKTRMLKNMDIQGSGKGCTHSKP